MTHFVHIGVLKMCTVVHKFYETIFHVTTDMSINEPDSLCAKWIEVGLLTAECDTDLCGCVPWNVQVTLGVLWRPCSQTSVFHWPQADPGLAPPTGHCSPACCGSLCLSWLMALPSSDAHLAYLWTQLPTGCSPPSCIYAYSFNQAGSVSSLLHFAVLTY